ncbi:MAG TPA: hypothetical protein VFC79_13210 [Tissierellaceae bacterium]|nr:hypothetical protein [Tissierellaceae bacterium]
MAVVKSKRGESELDIITKSRELAVYTIKICTNEKNFPKRYRWCVTNEIVKSVVMINSDIRRANEVFVKDDADYLLRKDFQSKAMSEIGALLGNMDIAYELFGVESKRIQHWTGLIIDVQILLRNWKKSDTKRFSK